MKYLILIIGLLQSYKSFLFYFLKFSLLTPKGRTISEVQKPEGQRSRAGSPLRGVRGARLDLKYVKFFVTLHLLFNQSIIAQNTFNIRSHLNHPSAVFCGVHATDTGYFVTGVVADSNIASTIDAFIGFWDTIGQLQWLKTLVKHETWTNSLIPLSDGFVVPGYRYVPGIGIQGIIIKYSIEGDTVWTKGYYSPYSPGNFIRPDNLIQQYDNKGYYLSSTIQNPADGKVDIFVTKTDSGGQIIWDTIFVTNLRDIFPRTFEDSINTIVYCLSTTLGITLSNYELRHQFWWLDSVGNVSFTYTTPNIKPNTTNIKWQLGVPKDLIKTKDGGWLMGTSLGTEIQTAPPNPVLFDPYIYKLDSNLGFQWERKIWGQTPSYTTEMVRIFEQTDSSIIAFGTRVDSTYVTKGMMVKLSSNGDSLWARYFYVIGNPGDEHILYDAKSTSDGGYIICGEARAISGGTPQQGWLLKLDSMGCLVPGCHLTAVENVGEIHEFPLRVYPNPATDYINIYIPKIQSGSGFQLHLYDLNGRLLQNHALPQSDATYMLTTEGLESGIYILQVLDDGGKVLGTEKVVVSK